MKSSLPIAVAVLCCAAFLQAETPASSPAVHPPLVHKNLQIFLISGDDRLAEIEVKTLDEAMKENNAVVHETGTVNKLSIENKAKNGLVFVQAGDIVKGGRQDRTLANDLLVSSKSGKLPLDAFCVESGRWTKRQGESDAAFSGSSKSLASRELKYAAKVSKDQSKVWDNVSKTQGKLSEKVSKAQGGQVTLPDAKSQNGPVSQGTRNAARISVNDARSATSLQLSLENKKLKALAQEYHEALHDAPQKEVHVVGFAYAVNGVMSAAEIYANHALFLKLWDKLLESAVHEAIAEQKDDAPANKQLSQRDAQTWLDEAETAATQREKHPADNVTLKKDAKKSVRFDTLVPTEDGKGKEGDWIHRSVLGKEGLPVVDTAPAAETKSIRSPWRGPSKE